MFSFDFLTSAFWGNSRDTALPLKLLAFVDKNKQIAAFGRISRTVAVVVNKPSLSV